MDVQLTDEDSNGGHTLQHFELKELLDYAEMWAKVSNDTGKNDRVKLLSKAFREDIERWLKNQTTQS